MPYRIEKQPDSPIVLFRAKADSSLTDDLPDIIRDMFAELDAQPTPVYQVFDLSNLQLGLEDVIFMANRTTRDDGDLMHHPKVIQNVFITADPMVKLALTGMTGYVFGNVNLVVHATRDEALQYCHEQIGQTQDR